MLSFELIYISLDSYFNCSFLYKHLNFVKHKLLKIAYQRLSLLNIKIELMFYLSSNSTPVMITSKFKLFWAGEMKLQKLCIQIKKK